MNKIRHWVKFRMPDNPREKTLIRVSLSPRGVIALNRPAHRVLGEAAAVVLLFDGVDHLIGIRPAGEGEEHAVPLRPRSRPSGGADIHAIKFCHLNRIPTRRTIAFNNIEIDDETTLVLNLHDTIEVVRPRTTTY